MLELDQCVLFYKNSVCRSFSVNENLSASLLVSFKVEFFSFRFFSSFPPGFVVSHALTKTRKQQQDARQKDYTNETNLYWFLKNSTHIVGRSLTSRTGPKAEDAAFVLVISSGLHYLSWRGGEEIEKLQRFGVKPAAEKLQWIAIECEAKVRTGVGCILIYV